MRTLSSAAAIAMCGVLIGCGPSTSLGGSTSDSSSGMPASDSTTDLPTPGSTTSGPADGTTTMVGDSGGTDSGSDTHDEDSGPGCSFTCPPPPPVPPTDGMCNCPEGEKCMPWANDGGTIYNSIRCSPIAEDPGEPGDMCTAEGSQYSGIDDCEFGSICFGVDPKTNQGTCTSFCGWFGDGGCPADQECQAQPGELAVPFCVYTCDPTADDCGEGQGCFASGSSFTCQPTAKERAPIGAACTEANGCVSGALCAFALDCGQAAGEGCCAEVCDVDVPDACAEPAECIPWFGDAGGPRWSHLGYCGA